MPERPTLALRPTALPYGTPKHDFKVVWKSDLYGERYVGRIRRAYEQTHNGEVWVWHVIPVTPTRPGCDGQSKSRQEAQAAFRKAFERFCGDEGDLDRAFPPRP